VCILSVMPWATWITFISSGILWHWSEATLVGDLVDLFCSCWVLVIHHCWCCQLDWRRCVFRSCCYHILWIVCLGLKCRPQDRHRNYTVNHKKRWQYICNHNSGKSWWILVTFTYMETGINTICKWPVHFFIYYIYMTSLSCKLK